MSEEKTIVVTLGEPTVVEGTATIEVENKDAFTGGCPIDGKDAKAYETYMKDYQETTAEAATDAAVDLFKSNPKIEKVVVSAPFTMSGRGSNVTEIRKEVESRNVQTGEKITAPRVRVTNKLPSTVSKGFRKKLANKIAEG